MQEVGVVCGQASDSRRHVTLLSFRHGRTPVLRTMVGGRPRGRHRFTPTPSCRAGALFR